MSGSLVHAKAGQSAVAIAKDQDKLRAVELEKHDGSFEILWARSSAADGDWGDFGVECGLADDAAKTARGGAKKTVAVGYSSLGVAFYHVEAPAVGDEEIAAIVRIQAETLLPLPPEQVEFAWRGRASGDGKVAVTVAAAKREHLQRFAESVRGLDPRLILLDCEAIVKAWKLFFAGDNQRCAVVSLGLRSTQVCLAEDGQLTDAVVLDVGTQDLLAAQRELSDSEGQSPTQYAEATDRFCQDMRSAVESFGCVETAELPLIVLSDGSEPAKSVVACLNAAGMNARVAQPQAAKTARGTELKSEEIYEYRVPLGLAAMAMDGPAGALKLFESLYEAAGPQATKLGLRSNRVAGVLAGVMLAALVFTAYAVDVATERRLSALESQSHFKEVIQRYNLMKTVAQHRPDLLELLGEINGGDNKGVVLDSFQFKKGQPINVTGQAQSSEQLYGFQKYLLGRNGIKEVNIQSAVRNDKDKKLKFTITFHYKNLTKKDAAL